MSQHTRLLIEREVGTALRTRWFLAYLVLFLGGGLVLTTVGLGDTSVYGYRGFARAIVGLVQLALLFVPIMVLFPAINAIGDDRETGVLEYLLAHPVDFGDVYIGKWLGVSTAVILAVSIGFGGAAGVAVAKGVPLLTVAALWGFLVLLASVFVSLGVFLSSIVVNRARAATLGTVFWLFSVALGTLGMMALFIRMRIPTSALVAWSFVNPIEAFRMGIVGILDPDLSTLGPLGTKLASDLGAFGMSALAALSMLAWILTLTASGWFVFSRWPRSAP